MRPLESRAMSPFFQHDLSATPAQARLAAIRQAWQGVIDPLTGLPLLPPKQLAALRLDADGVVQADVALPYPDRSSQAALRDLLLQALRGIAGMGDVANLHDAVQIRFGSRIVAHAVQAGVPLVPGVKNMIAVASGKGGVGKSTTAVNLALALAALGARVGVLDADIYGPSVPAMLGASGQPESVDGKTMLPLLRHGLRINSIGLLVEQNQALIWRAPMALQALEQLLRHTRWGTAPDDALDYLIVDMPPGTGDIQLSMSQRAPLTGVVMVTTPQDIALQDVKRGVAMFQKVGIPVLGVVENMAVHTCSQCGHKEHIFGADGGQRLAQEQGLAYLGALPLAMQICQQADSGTPTVAAEPHGAIAALYRDMALQLAASVAKMPLDYSHKIPTVVVAAGK